MKDEIGLIGLGNIFISKVDDIRETEKEIEKKTGCRKIKADTVECEKTEDWDKAYDIIKYHQKIYVEHILKEQEETAREKLRGIAI